MVAAVATAALVATTALTATAAPVATAMLTATAAPVATAALPSLRFVKAWSHVLPDPGHPVGLSSPN
ncbi:MAG: hypothetical protein ACRDZX_08880, partial [Acidimicrobiales bacterium]